MVLEILGGGTVTNVTISATTAGIACLGSCTLSNVRWVKAGDYAAAALGGPGTTVTVAESQVDSLTDKVYALCGSCAKVSRSVVADDVPGEKAPYDAVAVQTGDAGPRIINVRVGEGRVRSWYDGKASSGTSCGEQADGPAGLRRAVGHRSS